MTDDQFWAKKPHDGKRPPSVVEHCQTVLESADAVWTAVVRELAQSLGVDQARFEETVLSLLRVADGCGVRRRAECGQCRSSERASS